MMLASLNTNIPRYFIEHYWGERELGIFAALAYLVVAGNTVVGALGQSASPRLAKHHVAGDDRAFRRLLFRLLAIAVILGAAGVLAALLAGRRLLAILYDPEYADHAKAFVLLMAGSGFWYIASMLGYASTASRRIRRQSIAVVAVVLVSLLSSWILIVPFGITGAGCSSLLSAAACSAAYLILLISQCD